jgi:hypothetical protein
VIIRGSETQLVLLKTTINETTRYQHFPYDFYLKSGFNTMEEMRMMHFGAEK